MVESFLPTNAWKWTIQIIIQELNYIVIIKVLRTWPVCFGLCYVMIKRLSRLCVPSVSWEAIEVVRQSSQEQYISLFFKNFLEIVKNPKVSTTFFSSKDVAYPLTGTHHINKIQNELNQQQQCISLPQGMVWAQPNWLCIGSRGLFWASPNIHVIQIT